LTAGTLLYGWLASLEDKQINSTKRLILGGSVVESQKGLKHKSTAPTGSAGAGDTKDRAEGGSSDVWIHCSIGPDLPDNEAEEDRVQVIPFFLSLAHLLYQPQANLSHACEDRTT
jgi:hypothetical protein